MSFFESLLYGFVSGLTEFLPVSSQGHQAILLRLFGLSYREPARDVFVHIAILLSLVTGCKPAFDSLLREQRLASGASRRRRGDRRGVYELRLFRSAVLPLIIGLICYVFLRSVEKSLFVLSLVFIVNGILVIVPEYTRHGNKDGRFMSGWDALMIGIFGAFSAVPGISRIGSMNLYTTMRGVDRSHSLNWALLLSVPALLLFMFFDIVNLFTIPMGTISFVSVLLYFVSAIAAYCGGYFSILLMRYLSVHTGYAGFAYYSWGAAMFTFVLYLIV